MGWYRRTQGCEAGARRLVVAGDDLRWRQPPVMPLGIGDVGLQIIRDWVLRFNAAGAGWSGRSQGAWAGASAERRPLRGVGSGHWRERSDPCHRQCRVPASGQVVLQYNGIPTAGNWLRPDRFADRQCGALPDRHAGALVSSAGAQDVNRAAWRRSGASSSYSQPLPGVVLRAPSLPQPRCACRRTSRPCH